ncbi:hypothetical protein RCL1_007675 [Eukaryota sp. TZLM3-RCL]
MPIKFINQKSKTSYTFPLTDNSSLLSPQTCSVLLMSTPTRSLTLPPPMVQSSHQPIDLEVLETLSRQFPTVESATTEAINLNSILNLPSGTVQMVSDLHGAYDAVHSVIASASGNLKRKIDQHFLFTMSSAQKEELATLICYPEEKLPLLLRQYVKSSTDEVDFYLTILYRLIRLCRVVSAKYTRSKVNKALPESFRYVINELLSPQEEEETKKEYYKEILMGIIEIGAAADFVKALCISIQRLNVDKLYVLGDIYDRGDNAENIVDLLINCGISVELIFGNHDLIWIGAALGSDVCIATVTRISLRYNNINTLEAGYGISLSPLIRFADTTYGDDPCTRFRPNVSLEDLEEEMHLARLQKAMAIIQFKLERKFSKRNPNWGFERRNFLHQIRKDGDKLFVTLEDGKEYEMLDTHFPTINFDGEADPYELTPAEASVVLHLRRAFLHSQNLQRHVSFLVNNGSMYKLHNDLLLIHAGIPVTSTGDFLPVEIDEGTKLAGKELFDYLDRKVRESFFYLDQFSLAADLTSLLPETRERSYSDAETVRLEVQKHGRDLCYWLWCHPDSPLFQRTGMKTFESYFVADKDAKKEKNSVFFELRDDEYVVEKWLSGFGLPSSGKVICGHTPVKLLKGESPCKANNKLIVIDGGFSEAYREVTGIQGYTLIDSSHGLFLASHSKFSGKEDSIKNNRLMVNKLEVIERYSDRKRVKNTVKGIQLKKRRDQLVSLVYAYKQGILLTKSRWQ